MLKRVVIKAVLITFGILVLAFSLISFLFLKYNPIDKESRFEVIVATKDIDVGVPINESMLAYKTIRESSMNSYMLTSKEQITGKIITDKILVGDYISKYNVSENLVDDKSKIIVLSMDVDSRLANLIAKNSLIDIKVEQKNKIPKVVLSKIKVQDILDENGISIDSLSVGIKKGYGKFILDSEQRDKIYVARSLGKLLFELYIDKTQKAPVEEFIIPEEFYLK